MNREICRRCGASHCVILLKKKRKCAYIKADEGESISFGAKELLGTSHILEKYGTAFRYRYNDGGDITRGVQWEFDEYVPVEKCNCPYFAEQMIASLNKEE